MNFEKIFVVGCCIGREQNGTGVKNKLFSHNLKVKSCEFPIFIQELRKLCVYK